MSLESDLTTSLQGNATLAAVVSTRTEPAPLRQAQTLPAVTWFVAGRTFEQPVSRSIKGTRTTLQFDTWAATPAGAETAMAALKTALLAFTTSAHCLEFIGEWDIPEPEDIPIFHRALRVDILT